jgi:rhamnosyl/mannosyltransferase
VLALTKNNDETSVMVNNHLVHRCKADFTLASTPFSSKVIMRFLKLAKRFDIIHLHFPYPYADFVYLLSRLKKPVVITYHSDIVKQKYFLKLYRPLKHNVMAKAARIVATSPNYLATSKVLSKYTNKVTTIPIAICEKEYSLEQTKVEKWQKEVGDNFFLFVGVLRYYKGLHILLEAVKNKSYDIVIVGAGPIEPELKKQAKELGLTNVIFLGAIKNSDKSALFHLCKGVVFPSHLRSEAFGITLLEGAVFSKPLISSEIGTGTSYINVHNETGLIVPPSDPDALGQALDLLWDNPKMVESFGKAARKRYEKYFKIETMAKSYFDVYKDVYTKNQEVNK